MPEGTKSWQFNFKFDLEKEDHAQESIDVLQEANIQFDKHKTAGIDHFQFAEALMTSGLVLNEQVAWITFHGGFDFGYLISNLMNDFLPRDETIFMNNCKAFFPFNYDVKYLVDKDDNLKGGLNRLAEMLEVERIGTMHQAGSDALVTGLCFFKICKDRKLDLADFNNILYGLGESQNADPSIANYKNMTKEKLEK